MLVLPQILALPYRSVQGLFLFSIFLSFQPPDEVCYEEQKVSLLSGCFLFPTLMKCGLYGHKFNTYTILFCKNFVLRKYTFTNIFNAVKL